MLFEPGIQVLSSFAKSITTTHKNNTKGDILIPIVIEAFNDLDDQKLSYSRKYQIYAYRAYINTQYATLWGIEEQRSVKRKELLLEKKNMLANAKSLSGRITGSMRL